MTEANMNKCRFCLKVLYDNKFDIIGEVTSQMLNALLLKVNLENDKESVMCLECATILQNAVDFKTTCLNAELQMSPLIACENDVKFVSKEEKWEKNTGIELTAFKNQKVCQFCLRLIEDGSCIYLQDRKESVFMIEMVQRHIPELHFSEEVVTCEICLSSLESLLNFIGVLSETEGKIKEMDEKPVHGLFKLHDNKDFPPKCENVSDIEENYNNIEVITVKNEIEYEDKMELDNLDVNVKNEEIEIKLEQDDCESVIYNCEEKVQYSCERCSYKTKNKYKFEKHKAAYQSRLETTMYKCEICSYLSKNKFNVKIHMSVHRSPSEMEMYSCESCLYVSKYKRNLQYHQSKKHASINSDNHTLTTQGSCTVHKCNSCSFTTKHKNSLKVHMLTHKSRAEIKMYRCKICPLETIYKQTLKRHMNIHAQTHQSAEGTTMFNSGNCLDPSATEGTLEAHHSKAEVYKCDSCSYASNQKSNLKRHILTHLSCAEVTVYRCDSCLFATKLKQTLKRHQMRKHSQDHQGS